MLRKLWAFYKRDSQIAFSNRFQFFYSAGQAIFSLVSFFLIGKLVTQQSGMNPYLAPYQGDYFRFVLTGVAFSGFMTTALGSFGQMIQFERWHGTLEEILLTPTSFIAMALGKTFWNLTAQIGQVGLYLFAGVMLFQVDLSRANWPALIPTILLTTGTFLGIGMIFAGCSLLWREDGMMESLFGGASRFLAGIYFPVAILPQGLRVISNYLPLTYSLEAMRKSLLEGTSAQALGKELTVLSGFSLIFLPTGFLFFRWALRTARRQGTLALT